MIVKELIERLALENPQKKVVVDGYESGFDEVDRISYVNVVPNPDRDDSEKDDRWWDGEFEMSENQEGEDVILLPRKS
jgi:hypothetical protein